MDEALTAMAGAVAPMKGRGAVGNPAGRFERVRAQAIDDGWGEAAGDFGTGRVDADRRSTVGPRHSVFPIIYLMR